MYADGGVRYGADVLKLLSLGVKAVGLGRPFMFANTYGQKDVEKAIGLLKHEIAIDAGNLGVGDLKKINLREWLASLSLLVSTSSLSATSQVVSSRLLSSDESPQRLTLSIIQSAIMIPHPQMVCRIHGSNTDAPGGCGRWEEAWSSFRRLVGRERRVF